MGVIVEKLKRIRVVKNLLWLVMVLWRECGHDAEWAAMSGRTGSEDPKPFGFSPKVAWQSMAPTLDLRADGLKKTKSQR